MDVDVNVSVTDSGLEHRLNCASGDRIDQNAGVAAVDHPDRVVDAIARSPLENCEAGICLDQPKLHQLADRRRRVLAADDRAQELEARQMRSGGEQLVARSLELDAYLLLGH